MRYVFVTGLALIFGTCLNAEAANRRYAYEDDQSQFREVRDGLDDIRHEVTNHEAELRMFQDKLANQDATVEALRQQLNDTYQAQKDQLKGNAASLETKMTTLETTSKGLVADLKVLKEHANASAAAIDQYGQKLAKLEKVLDSQAQNLTHLETALRSLMDAMQIKDSGLGADKGSKVSNGNSYKVKPGDSLGKIAVDNKTTIKVLRDLNPQINNDKIVVGQSIQLP